MADRARTYTSLLPLLVGLAPACTVGVDANAAPIVIAAPEVVAPCNPSEFRTGSRDVRCETTAADGSCTDANLTGAQPGPAGGIMPFQPPPGPEAVCNNIDLSTMVLPPRVVFLVDRSASMGASYGGTTRWNALRTALFDPVDGVATTSEATVEMGIAMFNCQKGDGTYLRDFVPPALNNGAAMAAAYDNEGFRSCTRTHQALSELRRALPPGTTIILSTDGRPGSEANTEAQAALSFAEDNWVYAVSVGNNVSLAHLQRVVTNGTGGAYTEPFIATTPAALSAALATLVGRVGPSCDQPLSTPGPLDMISGCSFTVAGTPIPADAVDGWTLPGPGQLRFNGDSCNRLTGGDPITGTCSCQTWTPPSPASWRPELPSDCPQGTRAAWTSMEVGFYAVDSTDNSLVPFGDPMYPFVNFFADISNPITGDLLVPVRGPVPVTATGIPALGIPPFAYDPATDIYTLDFTTFPGLGSSVVINIDNIELQLLPSGFNVPVLTHFALVYECRPVE